MSGKLYSPTMSDVVHSAGWRDRLRSVLTDQGLSKRGVSLAAKLGPGAVHSWLAEGKDPSVDNLLAVCGVLNISLTYLVRGYEMTAEAEEILRLLADDPASREGVLSILRARRK